MTWTLLDILGPLLAALAAGALVGLERGLRSEPAGFRTQALVCVATAAVVLGARHAGSAYGDPAAASRIAQGVVTGIGFLGAGVIMRQGLSIQNLTTAASVWAVATVGVLFGYERYIEGAVAAAALLVILTGLRWFDRRLPRRGMAQLIVRYDRAAAPDEAAFKAFLHDHGLGTELISHRLAGGVVEMATRIEARRAAPTGALSRALLADKAVVGFDIEPLEA